MKNTIITEFVRFTVLETVTNEQLIAGASLFINDFLKKQIGFLNAELFNDVKTKEWCFIIHYDNWENINAIAVSMRNCKEFDQFKLLLTPGSLIVSFSNQIEKW